ncbi:glycosyltransferase family 4 protein [Nonomuraea rhizosphaerae]|uniref:glycosyltransferase family 4 protein n=1 Tax=Nonomuraea rhizosphaerae TaxID=2665663 RepID=UPI001C5DB800|nr:glycosyltransferase family 4 protein [Nonomuraea rhizosphaerae]
MRIAIIGPTYPYKGGGAQHTTELAHRLSALGHDVVIESWRAQYPAFLYPGQQTISAPEGTPYPRTHRRLDWRNPAGWVACGRRLRGADLVVLAVLSPVQVPAYLGVLYGLRHRARTVALCHNVLPHEHKPYDRPLVKALLNRVDAVLTHSDQQASLAASLADRPVSVAALPPHLPSTTAERSEQVRRRLLFFGIVRPYKGLDLLLRALPEGIGLTVAGEFWGGLDDTKALVERLRIGDRVELRPGYVAAEDVPGLFANADALVLPYRNATASQNVWLGHEHGVPVIATRVGALADHVTDGVDGLLVEPGDVEALKRALTRFYAPGEPERLRSGVKAVDPEPFWSSYTSALLGA